MKFLRIDPSGIVYKTRLQGGVAAIPASMVKDAERRCRELGRTIATWEGNFHETKAVFAEFDRIPSTPARTHEEDQAWREQFAQAGLTENGVNMAMIALPVLLPVVQAYLAHFSARSPATAPWDAKALLQTTIGVIALRNEHVKAANGGIP